MPKFCKWKYNKPTDKSVDYYETQCGNAICMYGESLKEYNYNYCPYCGKKIQAD